MDAMRVDLSGPVTVVFTTLNVLLRVLTMYVSFKPRLQIRNSKFREGIYIHIYVTHNK
jgi:hypothetical protein